jgi:hypothetical protein
MAQITQKKPVLVSNWKLAALRSSGIRSPTPAPVKSTELERMRNTSAKASVTSAK